MAKKNKKKDKGGQSYTEDLKRAISEIDKRFGEGSIMNLQEGAANVARVSSGSIALDIALGGGFPKGRIIEIYGPESSGKTTLALHLTKEVQKAGGVAALIDVENAFDPEYAEDGIGVDISPDKFLISQPECGEDALEITNTLIESGGIDLAIIDSVAALTPRAELDGDFGESKMGLQARMMSQAMRKLVSKIKQSECTVIFINQLRDKIGVMFGNPETTTGGNALKFYASVRLDIRRVGQIKDGEEVIGNRTRVKVVKNKVAPPFRKAEFDIRYGEGIDYIKEIMDFAVEFDIIKKSGSWFSYDETKLGQGEANVRNLLEDNFELLEEIEKKVIKKLNKS